MKSHAYLQPLDLEVGFTLPRQLVMISPSLSDIWIRSQAIFYMRKESAHYLRDISWCTKNEGVYVSLHIISVGVLVIQQSG